MEVEIIELDEIRQLKRGEKSLVLLMREKDGEQCYVQKKLQGRHPAYEVLAASSHPYLPKVYEVTISEECTSVIEEYIEGPTLELSALTEKEVRTIVKELCGVLHFLHEKGIVHRDIKPSNIIRAKDGHIRLIDFDAARFMKDDVDRDTKLLVTHGYAPPEQYGFSQTDERADIYALGITFKELLGDKARKLRYQNIIKRCTDLNPDKRYSSVRQVEKALFLPHPRLVLIALLASVVALAWGVFAIPSRLKPQSPAQEEAYYSDKDLLFNVDNGEYILLTASEMTQEGKFAHMQVDMTGNGDCIDFAVPQSLNNWIEFGERLDLSFYLGELADGIQATFWSDGKEVSLWSSEIDDLYRGIPYDPIDLALAETMMQITCVDADGDGKKELFVSQGDRECALLTTAWRLDDIAGKAFEFVGVMWGTSQMHLYENGDIKAVVNEAQLNHYRYSDGELSFIEGVDFEEFKAGQEAETQENYYDASLSDFIDSDFGNDVGYLDEDIYAIARGDYD